MGFCLLFILISTNCIFAFISPLSKTAEYVFTQFINHSVVHEVQVKVENANCKLVINEVNTGSPENMRQNDFIELKALCDVPHPKKKSLQGYKIIGLSTGTGKSSNTQQITIDLVVNLWNSQFNDEHMFTIGTEHVPNVDMTTKSEYVAYRNKFTKNTGNIAAFMNKGNKHLHGIAILYKKDYAFPEFVLTQKKPFLIVDESMQEIIKTNLSDFIVYGRKAPYEQCEVFGKLYEEYSNKAYILIHRTNRRKRKLTEDGTYEEDYEWETTKNFQ